MSVKAKKPVHLGARSSIKTKVTTFALLATLVPAVIFGLLYYSNNRTLLEDKIDQSLRSTADLVRRDALQWVAERHQELGVFGTTYLVLENVQPAINGDVAARLEISTYLMSVLSRSPNLEGLAILSNSGELVVATDKNNWSLPDAWEDRTSLDNLPVQPFKGGPRTTLIMGVQMTDYDGNMAGLMVGRVHLRQLDQILNRIAADTGESVCLIDADRRVIAHNDSAPVRHDDLVGQSVLDRLGDGKMMNFWHADGTEVVGLKTEIRETAWSVLAERRRDVAYADIGRFEMLTLLVGFSLMLSMAGVAYIFSNRLSAPLSRLTEGASQVAGGDLDVEIAVHGKDEIAYLTRVFNNMVQRLNASREQVDKVHRKLREQNKSLQVLSNTDALTGLYNRQHLNERLDKLVETSARSRLPFAILMLDLDRFKALNDRHGHVAGDRALKLIAEHICDTLRKSDYAARYGGEEFVVLLPKVDGPHAFELAERLRLAVASTPLHFDGQELRVTTSIGVAAFPEAGRDGDLLIRRADEALYQAKAAGRNTTIIASGPDLKVIQADADSAG